MEPKKFKILIADDEYWTREKIRNMLDWNNYGLEFLEPAIDGEDVLNKIKECTPDILITDINMPFINGVELLKVLQEQYPEIVTFVISGYDDFDYVKETFMTGSINYLVKPVSKIDLVKALSRALEVISKKQSAKEKEMKQKYDLLKASSLIQDMEFSQLMNKNDHPLTPNITMNSEVEFAGASLMLIKIHNMSKLSRKYNYDMNLLSYSVKKIIKDISNNDELFVFNNINRSNEFIVISETDNKELTDLANKFLLSIVKDVQSPLTIVISDHSYSIESIHKAYVQTISELMTRRYSARNELLVCSKDKKSEREGIKNRFGEVQAKEVKGFMRNANKAAIKELVFETVGLAHCEKQKWDYLEVRQTVKKVLNIMIENASETLSRDEVIDMENFVEMADKVIETLNSQYLVEVINDFIEYVLSVKQEEAPDSISGIVKQAAAFIDENYFEELTLSSLAKQFNVESSYFSRVFRKEIGENLMLYIYKTRIEKAKEYMQKSNVNLTEIAFMVGYDDYTYFNKVFRKVMGMSPRDYKNSISGNLTSDK